MAISRATAHFVLPKPNSQDDHVFEDLVCDVMARRLPCRNLQRYGRSGQAQYGVDVAGLTTAGVVGIQCKHHPASKIPIAEIDTTVEDAEDFEPHLTELYLVTSADRDTEAHSHALTVSRERQKQGLFPVTIVFWDTLAGWLGDYPDLVYKYFSQFFPIEQLEHIHLAAVGEAPKVTVTGSIKPHELREAVVESLHGVAIESPYLLSIGVSTFPDTRFDGLVDLQLLLAEYFENEENAEANFEAVAARLREVKAIFNDPFFSSELLLYLNVRLALAYLIGWIFRRVTRAEPFSLRLIANSQVWATDGLPVVATRLTQLLPEMLNPASSELAVVLNITRETDDQVRRHIRSWDDQPKALVVLDLDTHEVRSAAHALSLAQEISRNLKALMDKNSISRVHLFGAIPAALATLIGYHLNAIQPITLYFLDTSRQTFLSGGTIHNQL